VTINTGTDPRSVITWDSFNIDNGDTVIFNQLNNQSIALNKVTGPLAQSTIDGILQSNGHVWILNPAGVAFGANANIDVGALLATTADIDNATFMATDPTTGTFTFTDAGGTGAIIVANGADLDTTGLLALVAPMVTNSGDLTSSHGDVLLGGAEAFRIKFASTARNNGAAFNELLVTDFIVDGGSSTVAAGGDVVHQTSTGRAIGGRVIADASRVGGGAFLNMEGLVEAQNVGTLSGDVMLLGGVDLSGGALGATATDAVKTDNMTIVAPGTATVQGTAVTIGSNAGPLSTGGGGSSTGSVAITATTGDATVAADIQATAGDISVQAANGNIDVGQLIALGSIDVSGRDIDLTNGNATGVTTVLRTTNGALSLTATNGDISKSAGIVDIDVGTNVTFSGNATGATSAWAIDLIPGTVTADDFNVQFVRIGAAGSVGVGNVTASQSAEVISTASTLKVGNVSSDNNITLSGTDVDLTGTGGSLQSTGGTVSVTATGGGANNISATGAIDIDADTVSLSGTTTGTIIDIDADNGTVTANAVTASAGVASVDATGNVDVDDVSATTMARVVSSTGAVDVGNVTGVGGITVSGTDVDLTGTGGSLQSTSGTVSVSASGGGVNNISATGAIDIDGDVVALTGPVIGTSIDIDADNGAVTANNVTATGTSVTIDATGNIDVDDVTGTATGIARVVSSGGAVDVGDVTGTLGVTISGTDVDLTGTNGKVIAAGGVTSITASGGGVNNISSAGAMDIDGAVVTISGATSAVGNVDITSAAGTTAGDVSGGSVVVVRSVAGPVDVDDVTATGTVQVVADANAVDVGNVTGPGGITISGTDVDLTGTGGSLQSTGGIVSVTASGGGANNISAAGAIDIDADVVSLSGTTTGTSIDIDADNGTVTANAVTATGASVAIDATGDIDADNVSATTTVRVVSSAGAVDVGNVTGPAGVTISGTDIDLTGAGGSVQSANGATSLSATGGGANDISAAGAMDIDGDSILLSGPVVAGGAVALTADVTDISSGGVVNVTGTSVTVNGPVNGAGGVALSATTGSVSADSAVASAGGTVALSAVNGDIDVTSVSGATGATFVAQDIDVTGSINAGAGPASLTATAGDISTPGLLDIDGGSISLTGTVQAGTGIDLDASTGGITATADMTATAGSADLRAVNGVISVQGVKAPDGISIVGAAVNYFGMLMTQGQVFLEAMTGALTGSGTSSVAAPNGGLTARALGGAATLNDVVIGGDLSLVGGSSTMTGTSTVGGTATLQALTGNVHVAGSVNATGGILLIEAPSGAAVINSIASNSDVSLVVLDLDLTGTISAGDQFNLTPAGTGRTIIIGGSGGTDGVTLRRPQGFTLDASEVTRIIASKLQINAGANDLALLDATFDPAALQSLFLGADANARIIAAGNVTGLPHLQLGFLDGATNARPGLILVSGALGRDTAADRLASLRLESSKDIVIGTQAFLDEFERAGGNLDLSMLGEPDLARFNGTQDHVFIAADQLRLFAPGEIVQLNTGTSFVGAGVVFGEAPAGEGTIVNTGGGPERVNLFGTVIRSTGERVTSFEAGLEPNLLGPGLSQNGELRLNLCVIGDSSSCSIAILREAQESARSRNSVLSSLTYSTSFGFEDDDDDDDEEEDLGGVAGSGNEGLWGVGLP
jgi:filamentous hemagglutinin family protein